MSYFQGNVDRWLQLEVAESGDPLLFLMYVRRALERLEDMSEEEILEILPEEDDADSE